MFTGIVNEIKNMKEFDEQAWNEFRSAHPELRFWQALRQFCEVAFIWHEVEEDALIDTFYIKDKKNEMGTRSQ